MDNKEIHFYACEKAEYLKEPNIILQFVNDIHIGYHETLNAIRELDPMIRTTQMCFLDNCGYLFENGYRVFIHDINDEYELTLGGNNKHTMRELRESHRFLKLFRCGELSGRKGLSVNKECDNIKPSL